MTAIEVHDVGKQYRQYRDEASLARRLLAPHRRRAVEHMWALQDVDFRAARGETLAVIGRNGSGKTTLLRLLAGVSAPTTGTVRVHGRVAPLIGIGVGFNRELTGRENINVNARLLGMTPDEIDDRFGDIVDFSEIADFIDTPVKFYSSGMFLRLAFAVAIHTEPDVFVLDEILAVGDIAFQLKCNRRMREVQERGTTVVVVTHNLQMAQRLAPRTLVLSRGRLEFDGPTDEAISVYHRVMHRETREQFGGTGYVTEGDGGLRFDDGATVTAELLDGAGEPRYVIDPEDRVRLRFHIELAEEHRGVVFGFHVEHAGLGLVYATMSEAGSHGEVHGPGRPLVVDVEADNRLLGGTYAVVGQVRTPAGDVVLGMSEPLMFQVVEVPGRGFGVVALDPTMRIGERVLAPARIGLEGE